jgi:hypothetical protein
MRLKTITAAVGLIAAAYVPANAASMPRIGTTAIYFNAKGALLVNDVPVWPIDSGLNGTRSVNMNISMWLVDGTNTVAVAVEPLKDNAKVTLKVKDAEGKSLFEVEQRGAGQKSGTITVQGIPKWRWQAATPVAEGGDGLAGAVAKLHDAYRRAALKEITLLSEPYFTDNEKVGGMDAVKFLTLAGPMLKAGTAEPLPQLTVTRHADGRLFRVVGPDGKPPISIVAKQGEMTRAIRTGEWWSMLDGAWKVVR